MANIIATRPRRHLSQKRVVYLSLAILIILLALAGVWWVVWGNNYLSGRPRSGAKSNIDVDLAILDAQARNGKDITNSLSSYDQMANSTASTSEKQKIYLSKATAALVNADYPTAIEAGKQADAIKRDENSVSLLADIYAESGDTANAKTNYNLALDEAKKAGTSYDYYEKRLAEIK